MIEWLGALAFGEIFLLGSFILTAVAGYVTLNNKVNYLIEKDKLRDTKLQELEKSLHGDVLANRATSEAKFSVIDERLRMNDVLIGRVEERLNFMSNTLEKIYQQTLKDSVK
jgi:hypothetical protein